MTRWRDDGMTGWRGGGLPFPASGMPRVGKRTASPRTLRRRFRGLGCGGNAGRGCGFRNASRGSPAESRRRVWRATEQRGDGMTGWRGGGLPFPAGGAPRVGKRTASPRTLRRRFRGLGCGGNAGRGCGFRNASRGSPAGSRRRTGKPPLRPDGFRLRRAPHPSRLVMNECGGTDLVSHVLPPMTLPLPTVTSPPRMVAPA